jgi:hypothetical protein
MPLGDSPPVVPSGHPATAPSRWHEAPPRREEGATKGEPTLCRAGQRFHAPTPLQAPANPPRRFLATQGSFWFMKVSSVGSSDCGPARVAGICVGDLVLRWGPLIDLAGLGLAHVRPLRLRTKKSSAPRELIINWVHAAPLTARCAMRSYCPPAPVARPCAQRNATLDVTSVAALRLELPPFANRSFDILSSRWRHSTTAIAVGMMMMPSSGLRARPA